MSADYEGSSSPLMLDDDLSRSMEDAFSFSSVSSSNLPSTSSTPVLSHPLGLSRSSSSKSDSSALLTEHKSTTTPSTTPQKASQSALKAAQDLESFFADQTPVVLTNIPLRHSSTSLLTKKPKSAPPTPTRSPISTLSKGEDGNLIYSITSSDTLEGVALKFGIKVSTSPTPLCWHYTVTGGLLLSLFSSGPPFITPFYLDTMIILKIDVNVD